MTTLEMEIQALKERVERLEERVETVQRKEPQIPALKPGEPISRAQLLAWLKAKGLIREPTDEERRMTAELAAEWRALSQEEKDKVQWELDHLPPGPMVSDIVSENRRSLWDSTTSTPVL